MIMKRASGPNGLWRQKATGSDDMPGHDYKNRVATNQERRASSPAPARERYGAGRSKSC